jgi:hypothetical protein
MALRGNLDALASQAPAAVESFSPGHWASMQELERRATDVIRNQNVEAFVNFLCDTAFLKQPYSVNRDDVRKSLNRYPDELVKSLSAIQRIDDLDYGAMDALATLPWFGRNGGRAFNSAVLRLVRPQSFGIIDWRNLAVIMGAPGFEGLLERPLTFSEFSTRELLEQRGMLKFTQPIYEHYNNALREEAARYGKLVADIDLILWAYSIQRRPFPTFQGPQIRSRLRISPTDRQRLRSSHRPVAAKQIVESYLDQLRELGYLRRDLLVEELCSLFSLIRDECETFGRGKRGKMRETVNHVVAALERAIKTEDRYRLLSQWTRWADLVDPASPNWRGINLPGSMILEGYMIFEDFEPVKNYFDTLYDVDSLEPRARPD